MTTSAHLRKTALSLPETGEERTGSGTTAFVVHGKRFASTGDHGEARLHLPPAEADAFLAAFPGAGRLSDRGRAVGVRVPLADIDGQRLNHWVRRAWLSRAPKRLVAQAVAADIATAGDVGDLPKAIGRPATRALTAAGITTLAQVADLTEAELRAMHGIGPKAVDVLRETLAADGRTFGEPR
ncbi:hypothetical protein [Actinomadura sp. WAC 06369]|uniref:hypothetical protein n=1 Tax=Actinomadura sp. WAC 06369 TaxID=2203193 RepID=UPI000F7786A1|nr:hypothetical protein [Actinomadura sp. WAC 06369]RSN50627.1 hypothetical protein DMH08_32360 [Actinomadura sp. WAC 06369]